MLSRLSLFVCALALAACSSTDDAVLPDVSGLAVAESSASVSETVSRLASALEAADPVGIVAEVDHAANAEGAGGLRATRVVLFGNPTLGTPLMQTNPLAGIDLPQKMLVFEDGEGRTVVGYNSTDYLAQRHGLEGVAALGQIGGALEMFARTAVGDGGVVLEVGTGSVGRGAGIETVLSVDGVEVTYGRLRDAIEGNPNLTVVAELNHQANAARVGLELPPIRLIVFGNPALGTPLMRVSQTTGIDLPQKMLVYRDLDGETRVAYNDPAYLARRHRLGTPPQIATIRQALESLAAAATADG